VCAQATEDDVASLARTLCHAVQGIIRQSFTLAKYARPTLRDCLPGFIVPLSQINGRPLICFVLRHATSSETLGTAGIAHRKLVRHG